MLQLAEIDVGDPAPGCVQVAVAAAGVNFIDIYMRSGLYPRPLPYVAGLEASGTIEQVGPEVEDFADRAEYGVYDGATDYGRREYYNIPAPRTFLLTFRMGF